MITFDYYKHRVVKNGRVAGFVKRDRKGIVHGVTNYFNVPFLRKPK